VVAQAPVCALFLVRLQACEVDRVLAVILCDWLRATEHAHAILTVQNTLSHNSCLPPAPANPLLWCCLFVALVVTGPVMELVINRGVQRPDAGEGRHGQALASQVALNASNLVFIITPVCCTSSPGHRNGVIMAMLLRGIKQWGLARSLLPNTYNVRLNVARDRCRSFAQVPWSPTPFRSCRKHGLYAVWCSELNAVHRAQAQVRCFSGPDEAAKGGYARDLKKDNTGQGAPVPAGWASRVCWQRLLER
jgi:hypothetical protein